MFGIVASVTAPFCGDCDRVRVTADGTWFACLYEKRGVDLRTPMRAGASDEELGRLLRLGWRLRVARGAEERAALEEARVAPRREPSDLHAEMHARGG